MSGSEPPIAFSYRCDQRWSELQPRGAGRHCAQCDRTVLDLGRMTRAQAVAAARRGECGRLQLDIDGRAIFRRDPERRFGLRALSVVGGLAAGCASPPHIDVEVEAEPTSLHVADAAPASSMEPMEPIPDGVALGELDAGVVAALEETIERPIEPTEEQRELTARKSRRRQPHYAMPMGVMICPMPTSPSTPSTPTLTLGTPTF